METKCSRDRFSCKPLGRRGVVAHFDGGDITSDGGAILLRELEAKTGIIRRFAGAGPHREFVTNIAAEMAMYLLVDGFLDGLTVMGYDACHRWYQKLWFRLLDTGAIVPGFAETDTSFDWANRLDDEVVMRNFLPVQDDLNVRSITAAARRGECFASTEAPLRISVDGAPMGGVVETAAGRGHRVRVEVYPWPGESTLSRVDIVGRGGEVLFSEAGFPGGVLERDPAEALGHGEGRAYLGPEPVGLVEGRARALE